MCYLHRDFNCLLRPENSKPVKRYGNETYPQLLKERTTLPTVKNVSVRVHLIRCIANYLQHG